MSLNFSPTSKVQIVGKIFAKTAPNLFRQFISSPLVFPMLSKDRPDAEMDSIKLTKITPKDYKGQPKIPLIYGTTPSKFGNCLAAFRDKALCFLTFYDSDPPLDKLKKEWGDASLREDPAFIAENVTKLFGGAEDYEICLKGTDFEMEVWEALLKVKKGTTASYEDMAIAIGRPKAIRAAARAVARNRIAYFVPCHRIIKKNGAIHKYGGGVDRKIEMLKDEGAI